jgi:hypothetical protein
MTTMHRIAVVSLLTLILGCGNDRGGDGNFDSSLSGVYFGSIQDNVAGPGTLEIDITQSGSNYSGTFDATFDNPSFDNSGTISGTIDGNSITVFIDSADPTVCDFVGSGGRRSEDRITGTFREGQRCLDDVSGSFDISR